MLYQHIIAPQHRHLLSVDFNKYVLYNQSLVEFNVNKWYLIIPVQFAEILQRHDLFDVVICSIIYSDYPAIGDMFVSHRFI